MDPESNIKPYGRTNPLLYSASLYKHQEFLDLHFEFKNLNPDIELGSEIYETLYFEYLTSLLPSIIEQLSESEQQDFYSELHYIFQRCPDFKIDFSSIHPSFCPPTVNNFDKSAKYCFALTLDQVKSLLADDTAANIHQLTARELKSSIINWYYLIDTLKAIENNLTLQYDTTDVKEVERKTKLKTEIDYVQSKTKHLNELIEKNSSRLKEISDLKSLHSILYPAPKTSEQGSNEFSAEEAVFRISYFANDGKITFSEFFSKLTLFVESKSLSEAGVISLFGALLKDEPFRTFMEFYNQKVSLQTLIDGLSSRYSDKKNVSHYENMLKNLTRKPGENLRSAMSRASNLISLTNSLLPTSERDARSKYLKQEYLTKLGSYKAKEEISKFILKSQREGLYVDYDTLLDIAIDAESDYDIAL